MKITRVLQNLHIQSQNKYKSSATKDTNFKDILETTMTKERNLENIFKNASEKHGVPVQLLKAVAKVESNFNPNALSSSGAGGLMQLMPGTAKGLGVKDVFDPEQNINGGAKYLSQLLKKYNGDITLTLAGYNAGPGNVAKYGGVPNFKETKEYIIKVEQALKSGGEVPKHIDSQETVHIEDKKTTTIEFPILNDPELIAKLLQLKLLEELSDHSKEDLEDYH